MADHNPIVKAFSDLAECFKELAEADRQVIRRLTGIDRGSTPMLPAVRTNAPSHKHRPSQADDMPE